MVVSPIEDTPADKAGVKAGDAILKIDGVSTDGLELMDAVHKMRGEPGTKVTITVWREGMAAPKDLSITRAVIKIRSVKSNLLDGRVGYIRLSTFMGKSAEDFGAALDQLESQGAQSLVIDLRNNPGGLLNAAADIAGHFVPKGKVIVSTASRYKDRDMEFDSDGGDLWTKPTVVLINGGSASASEILAGCLQDYGLAVVVGTKSFGKGSVQTILPLSDGAGLRLTTAKYLTPKGHSLHGVGVTPDVASDEEPLGKLVQDLADADCYALFWKDYLVEHPAFSFKEEAAKSAVKVSESSWQVLKPETKEDILLKEFGDWLAGHGHPATLEDLGRDRVQLLGKLKEELARKQGGEDAARIADLDEESAGEGGPGRAEGGAGHGRPREVQVMFRLLGRLALLAGLLACLGLLGWWLVHRAPGPGEPGGMPAAAAPVAAATRRGDRGRSAGHAGAGGRPAPGHLHRRLGLPGRAGGASAHGPALPHDHLHPAGPAPQRGFGRGQLRGRPRGDPALPHAVGAQRGPGEDHPAHQHERGPVPRGAGKGLGRGAPPGGPEQPRRLGRQRRPRPDGRGGRLPEGAWRLFPWTA